MVPLARVDHIEERNRLNSALARCSAATSSKVVLSLSLAKMKRKSNSRVGRANQPSPRGAQQPSTLALLGDRTGRQVACAHGSQDAAATVRHSRAVAAVAAESAVQRVGASGGRVHVESIRVLLPESRLPTRAPLRAEQRRRQPIDGDAIH